MSREIRLSVIAETRKYQAEMAKIPGVTEKQAARAALKFEKEMSKAQAKAAAQAAKAAKRSGSAWSSAMSTAAGILSADLIRGFVVAGAAVGQEIADLRNELGDLEAATGISTGALVGLRFAAEASGNSLSSMSGAIKGFPKRLGEAALGIGTASKALEQLDFSAEDAARGLQDSDAAFRDVVERLQGVEDAGERAALAAQIFGKAGVDLMQVLGDRRLEEFTFVAQQFGTDVGPDAIASAQAWQAQVTLLTLAMDGAKASIFDAAANSQTLSNVIKGVIAASVMWIKVAGNLRDSLDFWDQPRERIDKVKEALRRARIQTLLYMQSLEMGTEAQLSASNMAAELAANVNQVGDAAKTAKKEVDAAGKATDQLAAIFDAAFASQLTEAEKLNKAYAEQIAKINELEAAGGDAFQAQVARVAVEAKHRQDLADLDEKNWSERMARIDEEEKRQDQNRADNKARQDKAHAEKMEQLAQFRDASIAAAELVADVANGIAQAREERELAELEAQIERLDRLRDERREANEQREEQAARFDERQKQIDAMDSERARAAAQEQLDLDRQQHAEDAALDNAAQARKIAATKERLKDQRKAARDAAKAAKQAALLGVAVNTSAAILQAFAMFGPPPSPIGIFSAAAAASAGIFEAASIRRQKLPTAHSGEFVQPDETIRKVRAGEAILNQRAAADLGGKRGIDNLNRGAGAASGAIVVQSIVDGRVVSEAVARQLATRSGTIDQIMRQGRRPLGQLSPYGG